MPSSTRGGGRTAVGEQPEATLVSAASTTADAAPGNAPAHGTVGSFSSPHCASTCASGIMPFELRQWRIRWLTDWSSLPLLPIAVTEAGVAGDIQLAKPLMECASLMSGVSVSAVIHGACGEGVAVAKLL